MAKKQIELPAAEAAVLAEECKNDTRGRRIVSSQRWAEVLRAYPASGLTQAQYARREGVNYHTLVSRLGRARLKSGGKAGAHRERSQSGPLVSGFIEAMLPSGVASAAALEVVTPSGFIIRGADAEAVATLVRSLCI
jgi:hypothetical protein